VLCGHNLDRDLRIYLRLRKRTEVEPPGAERQANEREATIVAAGRPPGTVTIATQHAGRGTVPIVLAWQSRGGGSLPASGVDRCHRESMRAESGRRGHGRVLTAGGLQSSNRGHEIPSID